MLTTQPLQQVILGLPNFRESVIAGIYGHTMAEQMSVFTLTVEIQAVFCESRAKSIVAVASFTQHTAMLTSMEFKRNLMSNSNTIN